MISLVSRFVGSERRERERRVAEQEEQAAIARLVAMFETPVPLFVVPDRPIAVPVEVRAVAKKTALP